jgi:hypothetical protein
MEELETGSTHFDDVNLNIYSFEGVTMQMANFQTKSGDDGGKETPVPIPNTAVKLSSADGT